MRGGQSEIARIQAASSNVADAVFFFYLAMFGRYKATEFSSIIFNKSASDLKVNITIHI